MNVERLQIVMKKRGHNATSLAEAIKRSDRTIRYILSKDGNTSDDTVAAIAQALEVSADYLLDLSDDPTPNVRVDNLTEDEKEILKALRRGDDKEAIKIIASR